MSFNIFDDAQHHLNWLDKQPSAIIDKVSCDLCDCKDDRIEMIEAPDKGGYYCHDCFSCGDVESYLVRNSGLTKEQITNYIKSVKL